MSLKSLTGLFSLMLAGLSCAQAYEVHTITTPAGQPAFELRYFDPADGPFVSDNEGTQVSTWAWSPHLIQQINQGVRYWASLIQPQGALAPAVIHIGTYDAWANAFGLSILGDGGRNPKTVLQMRLQGLPSSPASMEDGSHAAFGLGPSVYPTVTHFSQIPLTGKDDIVSTAIHELGHGFGIISSIRNTAGTLTPAFGDVLGGWASLMVDDNGNPARPGQVILCRGCPNPAASDVFDVRQDKGMLVGPHIDEVLAGGLPGVPVAMLKHKVDGTVSVDDNYMSHIELKNSMMSHQSYRNYTGFMEAELAVLQDLGYTIDRRNFFGRSIYGSGLDVVNTQGYSARNAEGTAYLPGSYSTALLGLGLHVYGSGNRIRQAADLLTAGEGGAGIRVDGEGNALTIDPGVRVHADGSSGQGIMFAYGRNHTLVQRGDVEALGERGVGLRFDFGTNVFTAAFEDRGSYIHASAEGPLPPLPELDGPLVTQADISGRVAGREAAIYMSANAYVARLNLMQGARIEGDIVSLYDQQDDLGAQRLTTVSFGQRADAAGRATGQADADFRFAYTGNILGGKNLTLTFDGGDTRLNGRNEVYGAVIRPGARLGGNATYTMTGGGALTNQGTLAPGNSLGRIDVIGNYAQTASGTLQAEFDASGASDVLAVSGTATLGGGLDLMPMAGWYADGWSATASPLRAGTVAGDFDTVALSPVSPTLRFEAAGLGGGQYDLSMTRPADAYGRYGASANDLRAGRALSQLAALGTPAVQPLFRSLDFSAPDGHEVAQALVQVSPAPYSAGLAASLRRDRAAADAALRSLAPDGAPAGSGWVGHAALFGGTGRQDARGTLVGGRETLYGVVAGSSRRLEAAPDVTVGFSLDLSEQKVSLRTPYRGEAKATAVGLGAQWRYRPDAGRGWTAQGAARLGVERGTMDRQVAFADYSARHKADWTGYGVSAQAEGGYRFALTESLSAGPFVSLDYARLMRPGVDESGAQATRLMLDRLHADALRSRLGIDARTAWDLGGERAVSARLQLSWDREWLDRDVSQTARFDAQPAVSFASVNTWVPRDTLGLRAGLDWRRGERVSVGLELGGQTGGGYRAIDGQLKLRWAFR
ncbi:autotransporter outer membrane beta-barrel domain-containing protein [Castellaniella defragrans]|uniref:autotransporter outer membrane beta-barrel domain-containing protein n=1 Tax=Castellaniella defragrans TaxID=75697 RepID=UPI0023F21934|nr:autotransporter outer membrane beta-barrel domain-containing protein [Castellaniella defragrans]